MTSTIKAGTIMMQAGTLIPKSVRLEAEPYWHGWGVIKHLDGYTVDRNIRSAGWNFFFLAGQIQATVWGYWGERTVLRAMKRVLRKARPAKFNCLEITEISAKRFLGFPYVHVSAHSRHIQKSLFLQSCAERARLPKLEAEAAARNALLRQ